MGQDHLLGAGLPLRILADSRKVHSMILWGPPGTGKTTLAQLLARCANADWISMSAVLAGVRDVREAIARANSQLSIQTIVFVDEVHRFNKAQQDAFLPHVESGTITLIGATTENPSFEVIGALLSRTRVFVLKPLSENDIQTIVQRAMRVEMSEYSISDKALVELCSIADGDARRALNVLEIAAQLCDASVIEDSHVIYAIGQTVRRFDKGGEEFYNLISALHKSMRGSDPDASLYWFSRMIDGGCDPLYIARRLVRFASEDIGTADTRSMSVALDAWDAYRRLGSPEGELSLAEAVVYLASVPKSNAVYSAYSAAMDFVKSNPSWSVPLRFRNAPTRLMQDLDYGKGYRYAHSEDDAFVAGERYFPDEAEQQQFYEPSDRGLEARIRERLTRLRELNQKTQK